MQLQGNLKGNLKISVAMATYNGADFIRQQLDSLFGQTIAPDEIVICDDSRDDKTYTQIAPFEEKYPNVIKYVLNEQQLGVSKNFEKAISLTAGDIIFLSDQDDVWLPEKIQIIASLIINHSLPVGAFCNSTIVDEDLNPLNSTHWAYRDFLPEQFSQTSKIENFPIFARRVPAAGHNMAFNKELKKIILPLPDLLECHDTWIGLVIASTAEWLMVDAELTKFRQHQSNVSKINRNGQLKQAIYSIKNNTFAWSVELYDELIKRTSTVNSMEPEILEMLKDRQEHSATRVKMNCNIFKRLPLVYREIKNRRYFKYGRGWKNVIQDGVLRGIL